MELELQEPVNLSLQSRTGDTVLYMGSDVLDEKGHLKNNFPPFPKVCCIKPCFYQSIEDEILPGEFKEIAKKLYNSWKVRAITTLFSGVAKVFVFDVMTAGLSILFSMMYVCLTYVCWFRPAYNALRLHQYSLNFMIFFIASFIKLFLEGLMSMRTNGFKSIDIENVADYLELNYITLGNNDMFFILWNIVFIGIDLYNIAKMYVMYTKAAATFKQAKLEFKDMCIYTKNVILNYFH